MQTDTTPLLLQELTEAKALDAGRSPENGSRRRWLPRRVVFTPAALAEDFGRTIRDRVEALGLPVEELSANRLTGIRGADERETYRLGKSTLAVVTAPPSAFKLQPIPPSADWQFHLAEGCPAHCQYCYLAGSLSGPPVVRVFANLPAILDNLARYIRPEHPETSYEVSCYTDPLGIEHLTGSLERCIRWFGARPAGDGARLRWVSKFDASEALIHLPHAGRTRCRVSVNALPVSRKLEGGTSPVSARLASLGRLAHEGGYPVGLVIAPIMPVEGWEAHYGALLEQAAEALGSAEDVTVELITHPIHARQQRGTPRLVSKYHARSGRSETIPQVQQVRRHQVRLPTRHHGSVARLFRAGDCREAASGQDSLLDLRGGAAAVDRAGACAFSTSRCW